MLETLASAPFRVPRSVCVNQPRGSMVVNTWPTPSRWLQLFGRNLHRAGGNLVRAAFG